MHPGSSVRARGSWAGAMGWRWCSRHTWAFERLGRTNDAIPGISRNNADGDNGDLSLEICISTVNFMCCLLEAHHHLQEAGSSASTNVLRDRHEKNEDEW